MSPRQADDLFLHLDRQKVVSYCGEGEGKSNSPLLRYSFASFTFEEEGSVLMGVSVGNGRDGAGWENVHRDSTDKSAEIRKMHRQLVKVAEMQAALGGISVFEYEGKEALNILDRVPCLYVLRTRY